jgi:uncharacterized membrane protein YcaP (DUF421 family)
MLWNSWQSVLEVSLVGAGAYILLVLIHRLSGKRTLSKLNAFDFIVTIAYGSTLATTLLSPDVKLADGVAAFLVLTMLQLVVTFASVRFKPMLKAIKASPTRLVRNGLMLHDVMRRERVTEEEVMQSVRSAGKASLAKIDVVLETNGKLSVVPRGDGPEDALENVT